MNRIRQEAIKDEMAMANKTGMEGGVKMEMPKWAGVTRKIKSQTQRSFTTEKELQEFMKQNPQWEINQRYGRVGDLGSIQKDVINVDFYEHGYGVMGPGFNGRPAVQRWLNDEEIAEFLKDTQK